MEVLPVVRLTPSNFNRLLFIKRNLLIIHQMIIAELDYWFSLFRWSKSQEKVKRLTPKPAKRRGKESELAITFNHLTFFTTDHIFRVGEFSRTFFTSNRPAGDSPRWRCDRLELRQRSCRRKLVADPYPLQNFSQNYNCTTLRRWFSASLSRTDDQIEERAEKLPCR